MRSKFDALPAVSLPAIGLFTLLALSAIPAHADAKKVLMTIPRAVGRTAVNMVTFRNKEAAMLQWTSIAAAFADAETTRRSVNRGSTEHNPLLGSKPSGPRVYVSLLGVGMGYSTMTQVVHDRVENPRPFMYGITGLAVAAHGFVAYHNSTVCLAGSVCNLNATPATLATPQP